MIYVNQQTIYELALNMGDFTTIEMTYRAHRDLDHGHISSTYRMISKLVKWGLVERVGRRKPPGEQWQTVWRAVQ